MQEMELFRNYLVVERGLARNTIASYMGDLERFIEFVGNRGISSVKQVKKKDVIDFLYHEKSRGNSSNSISRGLVSIKLFFRFLQAENYIDLNEAELIESPRLWRNLPEVLSVNEVERLMEVPDLTTAEGIRDRAALELMYATGIRISELADLHYSGYQPHSGIIICKGKGSKERIVPVGSTAINYVNKYIDVYRNRNMKLKNGPYLFGTRLGGKFSRAGLWKMIHKYIKKLGLNRKITPHTLRHSFATHLIISGADIRSIQAMLGHAQVTTTQLYTHLDQERLKSIHHRYHPRP